MADEPTSSPGLSPDLLDRVSRRVTLCGKDRDHFAVRSPLTGRELGTLPRCAPEDAAEAVRRARCAQPTWARRSFEERGRVLLRFHDLLLERQEEVLDLVQLETGKARRDAFEELFDAATVARYYARTAARHLRRRRRRGLVPGLTMVWEVRHPVGVVGIIAPWNYPLTLAVSDAMAALMAGNGVVLKPDPKGSFTALWCASLLYEAGLPGELFQLVLGEGPDVGPPLLDAVDYVAFTGSSTTGRAVASRAGERLIGCSLELGGKNPMIVLEDADLQAAVRGAVRGAFSNAGQLCLAVSRLLVQTSVYDELARRFVQAAGELRLGSGLDYDADMGSLASSAQLEKVEAHLRDAVAKGARVLTGGRPRPDIGPFFYEPTVLEGVTAGMRVHTEETFGPVVALYRFGSAEQAVAMANDTPYGLNASVWTRDVAFGRRLATRIRAGTVSVNDPYGSTWGSTDAAMGGMKASGIGRRHGEEGIRKYTEVQSVAVQRGALRAPAGLGEERYARLVNRMLRVMRRVPGL